MPISLKGISKLISKLREFLKKEEVVQEVLKKYDLDDSIIDYVQIKFEPLDVSAKTVDGVIILNEKLLNMHVRDIIRYLAHELTHCAQQKTRNINEEKGEDYLDQEGEIEAFQTQLCVMEEMYDTEEMQKYLDGLMNHHGLKGKERREKIEELLEELPEEEAEELLE